MNARLHERPETFPCDNLAQDAVADFVTDFSDGARLWNEVLGNMDIEAQVAFMVKLNAAPYPARDYLHDEAREYLYRFVNEHGLDKARESWG